MIIYGKEKEILKAQKRSLAAWINNAIGSTVVNADNLMGKLSTGVVLCKLAKCIQTKVEEANECHGNFKCHSQLKFWERAKRETFFARDNAEMFIRWCKSFGVRDAVLFESDGLVLQTQPRNVVLCLLELAHLASKYSVLLPPPIQLPKTASIMVEHDEASECSDDDFFFTSSIPSPTKFQRLDSGCSSAPRSPSPVSIYSKTSSPIPSMKKSNIPLRKMDKNVYVMVNNRYNSRVSETKQDTKKSSTRTPSPTMRRSTSSARSDTISSRLRYDYNRNSSPLISGNIRGKNMRRPKNTSELTEKEKQSFLDKRVFEVARQCLKEENKIRRISEGRYSFSGKHVFLRIVRGNNVVVRLGGGWDTLEHFLSSLDSKKTICMRCSQTNLYDGKKHASFRRTSSFSTL